MALKVQNPKDRLVIARVLLSSSTVPLEISPLFLADSRVLKDQS
jgi:hypothetical protein